uniref:Uncharacterized protein n=1 Tax=Hyaloperonospora arabidopsidis (strain Emoy2) TaxID=559515 RepID=M4C133_HYAAE
MKRARFGGTESGGLRLKKSGEKSATDAAALRAARLRKYEAFHGTGHSLSGQRSTHASTTSGGQCLGSSGVTLDGSGNSSAAMARPSAMATPSVGNRLNGEAVFVADEEEKGEEKKHDEVKESDTLKPFHGEGRRLR